LKRLIATALLFIFLFNLGGYLLLFQYFIYRSDKLANQQISHNHYKRTELVEVKVHVRMPSVCNWDDYEQIKGQAKIKGINYNYVGVKFARDTMFLLCLPNTEKTRLVDADNTYAGQVSDSPANKKSQNSLLKADAPVSKYDHPVTQFRFAPPFTAVKKMPFHYLFTVDHPFITINGEPPELSA
jgi:hypothetical protein